MNPIFDQMLVAAAIAAAIGFFVVRAVRKKKRSGCSSDCGCSVQPKEPPFKRR